MTKASLSVVSLSVQPSGQPCVNRLRLIAIEEKCNEPFRIVAYGNSIISVSPTESAEALEACNFPMRELLAQARRTHPIRRRTLNK